MSANTSNFTSKKVNYGLSIEILSIDLKNQDFRENLANYSVQVKFAEKCMEISPDGDEKELPANSEESNNDLLQLQMLRLMTMAKASQSTSKLYFSPNDADDERSMNSDNIGKDRKRNTSRDTNRASNKDDICNDSSDEGLVDIERQTERNDSAAARMTHSRQSRRGSVRETKRDSAQREMTFAKATKTKVVSESFGSTEEVFEITPNCMSGLLAKHCFKYEVLRNCQLYGEFYIHSE